MALVQISDIIQPDIYQAYSSVNSVEKSRIVQSGVMRADENISNMVASTQGSMSLPFWNDLSNSSEPNISNDDDTDLAVPENVGTGRQIAYPSAYNNAWRAADLAAEAAGSSPNQRIRDRIEAYWTRQFQTKLVQCAQGVLLDNVANDSGDMTNDIFQEEGSTADATNKFSFNAYVDAAFTLGDMFDSTGVVFMHSTLAAAVAKQGDIATIRDTEGKLLYRTYAEHLLIVDDGCHTRAGTTDGIVYTTILAGAGAFGFGSSLPANPIEVERSAVGGGGGGIETVVSRKRVCIHPYGFAAATPAAEGYTNAEMGAAATWDRVIARKNIPLAYLRTNG
jgi:hypothetical protein